MQGREEEFNEQASETEHENFSYSKIMVDVDNQARKDWPGGYSEDEAVVDSIGRRISGPPRDWMKRGYQSPKKQCIYESSEEDKDDGNSE